MHRNLLLFPVVFIIVLAGCTTAPGKMVDPLLADVNFTDYNNEAYKIFIKYPADWQLKLSADPLNSIIFANNTGFDLQQGTGGMVGITAIETAKIIAEFGEINLTALLEAVAEESGVVIDKTETITIDGYEGIKGTLSNPVKAFIQGSIQLVQAENDYVYIIIFSYNGETHQKTIAKFQKIFEEMLKSISFQA